MKVYFLASFIFACEKQKVNAFGKALYLYMWSEFCKPRWHVVIEIMS